MRITSQATRRGPQPAARRHSTFTFRLSGPAPACRAHHPHQPARQAAADHHLSVFDPWPDDVMPTVEGLQTRARGTKNHPFSGYTGAPCGHSPQYAQTTRILHVQTNMNHCSRRGNIRSYFRETDLRRKQDSGLGDRPDVAMLRPTEIVKESRQ